MAPTISRKSTFNNAPVISRKSTFNNAPAISRRSTFGEVQNNKRNYDEISFRRQPSLSKIKR
jgi:hypothetical protein